MNIQILDKPDKDADAYANVQPDAKLCHTSRWTFSIARAMGHEPFHLVARDETGICGVLPLMHVRSRLFGNRLISQGFSNYGGPITTDGDEEVISALYTKATEMAVDNGCDGIEFRCSAPVTFDFDWPYDKVTFYLPLPVDPEELWKGFNCKVRNQIRKAKKSGLTGDHGGMELLDEFYRIWSIRMHQLGTPCYSKNLFKTLITTFPKFCRVFVVHLNGCSVGAAFIYCFKGFTQVRWAATLVEYNKLCPNNLLYWTVMKYYCLSGATCIDFGRTTRDSNQYKFKKQWGTDLIPLHYQFWKHPDREFSPASPDSSRFRRKVEVWKRLPLWATRLAGPYISRSLA